MTTYPIPTSIMQGATDPNGDPIVLYSVGVQGGSQVSMGDFSAAPFADQAALEAAFTGGTVTNAAVGLDIVIPNPDGTGAYADDGDDVSAHPSTRGATAATLVLEYHVIDRHGAVSASPNTKTITIKTNVLPTATPGTLTMTEETTQTISLIGQVEDNDAGQTLTVSNIVESAGTVVDNGNGTIDYTAPTGASEVTITFDVSDGVETVTGNTFTITVEAAAAGSVTLSADVVIEGTDEAFMNFAADGASTNIAWMISEDAARSQAQVEAGTGTNVQGFGLKGQGTSATGRNFVRGTSTTPGAGQFLHVCATGITSNVISRALTYATSGNQVSAPFVGSPTEKFLVPNWLSTDPRFFMVGLVGLKVDTGFNSIWDSTGSGDPAVASSLVVRLNNDHRALMAVTGQASAKQLDVSGHFPGELMAAYVTAQPNYGVNAADTQLKLSVWSASTGWDQDTEIVTGALGLAIASTAMNLIPQWPSTSRIWRFDMLAADSTVTGARMDVNSQAFKDAIINSTTKRPIADETAFHSLFTSDGSTPIPMNTSGVQLLSGYDAARIAAGTVLTGAGDVTDPTWWVAA